MEPFPLTTIIFLPVWSFRRAGLATLSLTTSFSRSQVFTLCTMCGCTQRHSCSCKVLLKSALWTFPSWLFHLVPASFPPSVPLSSSSRFQAAAGGVQCDPRSSGGVCAGAQERSSVGHFSRRGERSSLQWWDLPSALGQTQRLRPGGSGLSSGGLAFLCRSSLPQTCGCWPSLSCTLSSSQSFQCSLRMCEKASDLWELWVSAEKRTEKPFIKGPGCTFTKERLLVDDISIYMNVDLHSWESRLFACRIIPLGVREVSSPSRSDLRWISRQVSNVPWGPDPLRPQHDCSRASREGQSASSTTSLFVSASIFRKLIFTTLLDCYSVQCCVITWNYHIILS